MPPPIGLEKLILLHQQSSNKVQKNRLEQRKIVTIFVLAFNSPP